MFLSFSPFVFSSYTYLSYGCNTDAAARCTAAAPCTRRLLLPAQDFRPAVNSFLLSMWQRALDTQSIIRLRDVKPTLKSWLSCHRRNRRDEISLCSIGIDHTYVTHKRLFCGEHRLEFPLCRAPLMVAQVLLRCLRHSFSHRFLLGYITTDVALRQEMIRSGSK